MKIRKVLPKSGQTRYVKKFALFPVLIKHEQLGRIREWVWLEYYWQKQCVNGDYEWYNEFEKLRCREWTSAPMPISDIQSTGVTQGTIIKEQNPDKSNKQ